MKITYIIGEQGCGKTYIAKCYYEKKQRSLFCSASLFVDMTDREVLMYDIDTIIIDEVTEDIIDDVIDKAEEFGTRYLVLIGENI